MNAKQPPTQNTGSDSDRDRIGGKILIGFGIGVVAGCLVLGLGQLWPEVLTLSRRLSLDWLDPFSQIFLRLLFMVVVPLVFCSLAHGIVQLGDSSKLGPLAGKTGFLFLVNMGVGVFLALVAMGWLRPGDSLSHATREMLMSQLTVKNSVIAEAKMAGDVFSPVALVRMFFPPNLLRAVTEFEVMPLIVFSVLVGVAGMRLPEHSRSRLVRGLELGTEVMTGIVGFAMRLAPYAIPAMIFSLIVKIGFDILAALAFFAALVLGVIALHLFGTMSLLLKLFTRRNPLTFFRSIRQVLMTAFGTSSSNATLPASLEVAREKLGIKPSTAEFVLPLGAIMNMSGTALYEGSVVLFIAQVYGVQLGLAEQIQLLTLAVLSAIAVAGIPGGSLPMIAGLLLTFGIPPEGLAIIFGVDRLLDMARTTCNVGCDLVVASIVDEWGHRPHDGSCQPST